MWSTVGEAALSETGSDPQNFKQVVTGRPDYCVLLAYVVRHLPNSSVLEPKTKK